MATASPTPMGSSQFAAIRRPASRNAYKQPLSRPHSTRPDAESARTYSLNDSSDDEIPMPMKLSALTKALLNDEASIIETSTTARTTPEPPHTFHTRAESAGILESSTKENRSPLGNSELSPTYPRRIVRLSGTPGSSNLRRGASLSSAVQKHNEQAASKAEESALDLSTPAPVPRTVRVSIGRSSIGSSGRHSGRPGSPQQEDGYDNEGPQEYPSTVTRSNLGASQGSVSRFNPGRSRYGEDIGLQSSMRVKRGAVPKVFGTFMRGPARRGRPRISQSDEEHSPMEENANSNDVGSSQEPQSQESQYERPEMQSKSPTPEVELARRAPAPSFRDFAASGSPPSSNDPLSSVLHSRSPPPPTLSSSHRSDPRSIPSASNQQPAFKLPAPRPARPASHDQENEAPPTFKRNKQLLMHINSAEKQNRPDSFEMNSVRATGSPERRPLAIRSQNTPRRPAPPPPKMSVLEAATSSAGAATTSHANNRRNRLKVNGKVFTRLDVIGRGGSSKVYRVMAENSKIFALKRVSLEDADESAIRGFKGEIDLLKKLGSVERVIHLYDYEMNDERGILSVLMEMGELDMNTILNLRMKSEHAKLDINFVRYYWKEMLECLQAVHAYDIVHSDLKPHNFVLVQGRLKLIDFGIANAIQTEETVNVHRETQIGTPNYMSPESLMDSNASDGKNRNEPKLMKLGKPSDIWSLGCILYQMTYGRAPFGHIQNQLQRCQAIINFNYDIEYPAYGVGGVLVPSSLIRTLKNCLNRDQHQRPSAEELLGDNDTFLNPLEIDMDKHFPMTEELLGRILQNVIQKCETLGRVPSEGELLTAWPKGYFTSLRKAEQRGGS
ncbi:hypothetical protein MFRU_001g02710 [Monilinia fructicola]|uniref:Protein kinase domain-containing protein n=1 Tax=Monilinia fructicola TaxID=38448 RepID=A0A5M9JWB8_MONFR|nr:hypothetical protein EYC84_005382 [Monilinia fructicola]KAG4035502.1 hypothetical protein MFRU_001g02710 [Monilinia fructicola]